MKQLLVFLYFSIGVCSVNFAQVNFSKLTDGGSKTWKLIDLYIAGGRFEDTDSTCVYNIEVTFTSGGDYSILKPCSIVPTEMGTYEVLGSSNMIYDGDTLTVQQLSSTQFKTFFSAPVQGTDPIDYAEVITIYEKK